ncbi:TPA: phage/plasmid primase, P4 family [Staphylococcus aureus]|uniref:phage/plasmid primase, P4 family n=1 Tax=Staphylococcus aureus TaxID=1280 RepID=UPI0013EF9DD0|nr:phage/plasmid primase, P4 family [Staphylococcus aureus]MDU0425759.1 phage/plasmid primase, P4 family [Staphylococcus aureus]UVJ36665.1 phage/plasmid primase, P4 family [Staphylococcus aureus]HBC4905392.1 DNA primase [Staphylococcus aureus]HCH7268820.1 DNA primase [Staphylococcus aureus]HCI3494347.1 DNA primase [Staphylococcus aureus]
MAIKKKDKIIGVKELEIPQELKLVSNWVLWRAEWNEKQQNYGKVPYSINGYRASTTNEKTWCDFESVSIEYEVDEQYSGIGFVLSDDNNFVCLDIDNAIDKKGQINSELALKMMQLTYCEKSPSGTGLHCFFKGKLPDNRKKKRTDLDIELYDSARFMTVTGCTIGQSDICDNQEVLNTLVDEYFKENLPANEVVREESNTNMQLSDEDIINIMMKSKQKDKISNLLQGNYESYFESSSEAVQSLLHYLAFYTGKNKQQMERIFLNYNNLTDKWESKRGNTTWGQLELDKAINNQSEVYSPFNDFNVIFEKETVKDKLKRLGNEERAYMEQLWIEEGSKGRKPTVISPNRCAHLLKENLNFILFDLEENTKLAMYRAEEGIYTQNVSYIKRVISWLEPKLNSNKADEVIYHLKNRVDIKSKTNSPVLIPVKNGVFNRKTKQLESFTPEYVFTTKINTAYKTQSCVPVIEGWSVDNWINEIACNDHGVAKLLWQVINDSLNGNYTRKKAIFLVGDGNNGKGTFQELISQVIGEENIASLKVNEFDERFKLSVLEGKTAVIGDDVPVGVYVDDSSNFKSVVTGDPVLVEFKNQPLYRATFKCTVIQSTNGMPSFKDKTSGTLRRLLIVPFNANFNGQSENFKIKDQYVKNQKVLEYVLYRAVNMGFDTFDVPDASHKMLDLYKQDNDPVYEFKINVFDEWLLRKIPKYIVYGFYKEFCKNNGYFPISERKFHKQFKSYLSDDWKTDGKGKVTWDRLIESTGDLNLMNNGIDFPEKNKTYALYENNNIKAV